LTSATSTANFSATARRPSNAPLALDLEYEGTAEQPERLLRERVKAVVQLAGKTSA